MKIRFSIWFVFSFLTGICLFGQESNDSSFIKLPSLTNVLEIAMENSPFLKSKNMDVKIKEQDLLIQRRKWMNYFTIDGAITYGLYDRIMMQDNTVESAASYGVLSQTEQTTYYSGIALKLPFTALTNRKRELDQINLEIEKAQFEQQSSEQDLKSVIIEMYFKLKYYDESMRNFFEIYQTLQISYEKSKLDLYKGRTDLNEFALLASTVGKAKDDYTKARNTFWSEYYIFKNVTGIDLSQIKK